MGTLSADLLPERTSTTHVERGLYVLRYVASEADRAPSVFVRASNGSEDALTFVMAPDAPAPVLTSPGEVLVVRANERSSIQLTARATRPGGSVDANLRLELLQQAASSRQSTSGRASPQEVGRTAPIPFARASLRIVGHVSRRGDVAVRPDEWIAGPSDPAPIEGLEITGSLPEGLVLQYQVVAQGSDWSEWATSGQFLGSKGRFAALTGVRLKLSGDATGAYAIKASALFLGSNTLNETGQTVELRSATGHDPLVGLKLELVAREIRAPAFPTQAQNVDQTRGERKSRVRVFRAGAEQTGF